MSKRVLNLVTWLLTFGLCGLLIWLSVKDITDADIEKTVQVLCTAFDKVMGE